MPSILDFLAIEGDDEILLLQASTIGLATLLYPDDYAAIAALRIKIGTEQRASTGRRAVRFVVFIHNVDRFLAPIAINNDWHTLPPLIHHIAAEIILAANSTAVVRHDHVAIPQAAAVENTVRYQRGNRQAAIG